MDIFGGQLLQALLHHLKEQIQGLLLQRLHQGFEVSFRLAVHKIVVLQTANGLAHVLKRQVIQRLTPLGHDLFHLLDRALFVGPLLAGVGGVIVNLPCPLPSGRQLIV